MPPSRFPVIQCLRQSSSARLKWRCVNINTHAKRWQTASAQSPDAVAAPQYKRTNRRLYLAAGSFVIVGAGLGYLVSAALFPPRAPAVGTSEDERLVALLAHDIDNLPIVRTLRRDSRTIDEDGRLQSAPSDSSTPATPLWFLRHKEEQAKRERASPGEEAEAGWIELRIRPPPKDHITALMTGSGRVAVQRAFWSPASRELIMVVWLGSELCGWPGLAHGGAIATIMVEATKRAAECIAGHSLQESPSPDENLSDPAMLSITYKKPTEINQFYVLRARPARTPDGPPAETNLPPHKDLTKKHAGQEKGKALLWAKPVEIDGDLETLDGKVCVKVKTSWNI